MINIMYVVDPIKRIVKPMSGHAVTEQDHEASSLRFAFPDNIAGTGLDSTGTAVRVMYIRPDGGDPVAKTLTFYRHSGGYYLYDWNLQKSDLQKEGHLVFSLCILDISGGEVSEWHTTPCAVRVFSTIHTDNSDEGDESITPTVAQRVAVLESMIRRVASGAPIVVASTSAMTDTDQIYVLSTDGEWYYHNGTAWVAGGTYGAVATDTTLTQSGLPADAEAVGDVINEVKADLDAITNSATDASLWEQGSITGTDGTNANSGVRIRTGFLPNNTIGMFVNTGFLCGVMCWDSADTYVGAWNGSTFSKSSTTLFDGAVNFGKLLGTYKIKLCARNTAGTAIAVSDSSNIAFSALTDGTLTKQYIPADAKKVGDAINAVRNSVIAVNFPFVKLTKSSDIFTVEEGYYATTGNKAALAGYILCSYVAKQDFQIYADAKTIAGHSALFVSIYNNSIASGNIVTCYKRSDGTLPTEANKATVFAGQILAISIYSPSSSPADFGIYANYYTVTTLADGILLNNSQIAQVANKFTNFAYGKKIAWFGDSISELKSLPHITGSLMEADVYDCSIRGSTIGRTYSNYDTFSFYNLVTAIISGDFSAQFAQLDAYEQAQGRTYSGIRENLTTLSTLDFDSVDYVVLLGGTNDFGITAVHAADGYTTKIDEMKAHMDDAIGRFITAYPKLKFYIISPPFRATPTEDYYGDTLADYITAEQEVAEKYAIAFHNLLINSRICDANKTTYMNSDGGVYVHPNDYGDAWLAELCAKFISLN